MLDALVIPVGATPSSAVIWLHGLGADGHDFAPIVTELGLPPQLSVRFIFPHAPMMPVTINNGYVMPAWYDIRNQHLGQAEDEMGIRASQRQLEELIQHEVARGIPVSRIVLAGFSQGGAIALHTALRFNSPLAGVLALSTYLPLPENIAEAHPANAGLPIFMAHGTTDSIIDLAHASTSRDVLQQNGYAVTWYEYVMAHSLCPEEITDIGKWLAQTLS